MNTAEPHRHKVDPEVWEDVKRWVAARRPRTHRHKVDPEVWEDPVTRLALAARDITAVYRLLQKLGYSQHSGHDTPCSNLSGAALFRYAFGRRRFECQAPWAATSGGQCAGVR